MRERSKSKWRKRRSAAVRARSEACCAGAATRRWTIPDIFTAEAVSRSPNRAAISALSRTPAGSTAASPRMVVPLCTVAIGTVSDERQDVGVGAQFTQGSEFAGITAQIREAHHQRQARD